MTAVTDVFGEELSPGDLIFYISSMKKHKLNELKCGIYMSDFTKEDGWKMRIRNAEPRYSWRGASKDGYADNARITKSGRAEGVIKIKDPSSIGTKKVDKAIKLKQTLIKLGKLKPAKKPAKVTSETSTVSVSSEEGADVSDLLSTLGAPSSLGG